LGVVSKWKKPPRESYDTYAQTTLDMKRLLLNAYLNIWRNRLSVFT